MSEDYTRKLEVKVANYIAAVQPELDRLDDFRRRDREFVKRASQSVGTLVGLGLVAREDASDLVDKIAEDHTQAFEILEHIAARSGVGRMGYRSEEKSADAQIDPKIKVWTDAFSNTGN